MPLDTHTRYVPPHPQRGTPYHRYVLLVLPQSSSTEPIDIPVFDEAGRLGFDFRAFAEKYGFDGARGGGAHMWREVWDETVSHIYKHTLSKSLTQPLLDRVLIAHRFYLRMHRERRAEVRKAAETGPIRGAQAQEKVPLDGSDAAHLILLVVTLLIRACSLLRVTRAISCALCAPCAAA